MLLCLPARPIWGCRQHLDSENHLHYATKTTHWQALTPIRTQGDVGRCGLPRFGRMLVQHVALSMTGGSHGRLLHRQGQGMVLMSVVLPKLE